MTRLESCPTREIPAELRPAPLGQVVKSLFAVVGPASALLLLLDDLAADEPVGPDHFNSRKLSGTICR